MTSDDFKRIVEIGKESISLEFKESESWTGLRQKIVKCILAMSNTREGGYLVIGVKDDGTLEGVTAEHFATYDEEIIKDYLSNYADPHVDFDVDPVNDNEKDFVVITVREFSEIPIICKKDGNGLRKGDIYVRTRNRRPESVAVPDYSHMRDVIELATDKMNENLRARGWTHLEDGSQQSFEEQIRNLEI